MNSNQRNYEWNNNEHIPNDQMYQSHDESCNCSQNMYDKPQQNQEMNDVSSYTSMNNPMYEENQSYNESDNTENMGGYHTTVLPSESKRFQTLRFRGSKEGRGLWNELNPGPYSGYGGSSWCRKTNYAHQVANAYAPKSENGYFIFFLLDNGKYIIGSKVNGEVLTMIDELSIVSRPYKGDVAQEFKKNSVTPTDFRLQAHNNRSIDACEGRIHVWAKITSGTGDVLFTDDHEDITLPSLGNPIPLELPKDLVSYDDNGVEAKDAPRAIQGSVLIPAILVKDIIPLEQSIKQSPYYVLTYKQYWHKSWSVLLEGLGRSEVREVIGMYQDTAKKMEETINMSIGSDWKLRFFDKSQGFSQQIWRGLNTLPSESSQNIGFQEINYDKGNPNTGNVRYVKYNLAYEFALTRMDGTSVGAPWTAYHPDTVIKTFPHNMNLLVDNLNLVRAGNSYDLSIYKTPFALQDGKIYRKNDYNSKLYYE